MLRASGSKQGEESMHRAYPDLEREDIDQGMKYAAWLTQEG